MNYAQDDETSPYVIIGNDNRTIVSDTTVAPYRYIGRLVIYASFSKTGKAAKFSGTGFLVGPKLVMTAAHCLYPTDDDGVIYDKVTEAIFYPGRNGNSTPYGSAKGTVLHVPTKYKDSAPTYNKKYDYAVMELNTAIGNTTGSFSTDANYIVGTEGVINPLNVTLAGGGAFNSLKVTLAGYPGNETQNNKLYKHSGTASFENDDYIFSYTIDTEGGQSGSPLYLKQNGKFCVVGIHILGNSAAKQNYGRRITNAILQLVNKYN